MLCRISTRPVVAARARVAAPMRPSLPVRPVTVRAKSVPDTDELQAKLQSFANDTSVALKAKWEKTEDKPAAVLVAVGTVLAASLALGVVNTVDKIPVISDFVELVGIAVTGWFTYRYLTVGPDRDELFVSIKGLISKVYGGK